MADVDRWPAGRFCWLELATTDIDSARSFYQGPFGWDYNDVPMGEGSVYRMPHLRGRDIAGMYNLGPDQPAQGIPPHWMTHFAVELGGSILMPPADIPEAGRFAILKDREGAAFSILKPKVM